MNCKYLCTNLVWQNSEKDGKASKNDTYNLVNLS